MERSLKKLCAPAQGASMRKILRGLALVCSIALGLSGCATTNASKAGATSPPNGARIQEQQRIPAKLLYPKKLPAMTDDDVERLGDSYLRQGKLVEAFTQYDKLLHKHPGDCRLLYKRGMVYLLKGRNEQGLSDFRTVLEKEPNNPSAHAGAGQALFQLKHLDDAQKEFELALAINDRLWLAHDFLGIIYDYNHRYDLAVRQYQTAIALNPDGGALYNNLGVCWSLQGKWDKAVVAFEEALKRGYSQQQAGNNLGLALCHVGRFSEALQAFKRSGDQARAYNNIGSFYMQKGEYAQAVEAFQNAVRLRGGFYPEAGDNVEKARAAMLDSQMSPGKPSAPRAEKASVMAPERELPQAPRDIRIEGVEQD